MQPLLLLSVLVLAGAGDAGPSKTETFSDSGASSVHIVGGGGTEVSEQWTLVNLTYAEAGVVLGGKPETALVRRTETRSYAVSANERTARFSVDVFVRPAELGRGGRPTIHFEATGDGLALRDRYFEVERAGGLETATELFDLATQKSFLRSSVPYQRVEVPGSSVLGFVGYDAGKPAAGEHGRLILATTAGAVSTVTFKRKPGAKALDWAPQVALVPVNPKDKVQGSVLTLWSQKAGHDTSALSGFAVRLTFQADGDDAGLVVKVPVESGRFNGKERSAAEAP